MTEYLTLILAVWPIFALLLGTFSPSTRSAGLFLCQAFLASMVVNHWFGALVHIIPDNQFLSSENTINGFEATTWGMACFTIGALLSQMLGVSGRILRQSSNRVVRGREEGSNGSRIGRQFLLIGIVAYVIARTPLSALPSFGSIVSGASQFLVAGICIGSWSEWKSGNHRMSLLWVALALLLPVYTTLGQGFMGFGVSALMTALIFFGGFFRPRWLLAVAGAVAVYMGLSLGVAYLIHRNEIRGAVWGEQSYSTRVDTFIDMLASVTPFDIGDPRHAQAVDIRLNQNELIGAALHYTPEMTPFAEGSTLIYAVVALIPRAIWPDKPAVGGGGSMVSTYTGISFAQGTSVGAGPVFEFYINFGWIGISVGFLIFGFVMRAMDFQLAAAIKTNNWHKVAILFPAGLSMIQPLGSLVEITTSVAAAALIGSVFGRLLDRGILSAAPVAHSASGAMRQPGTETYRAALRSVQCSKRLF